MEDTIENEPQPVECSVCKKVTMKTLGWLAKQETYIWECGTLVNAREYFQSNELLKLNKEINKMNALLQKDKK